MHCEVCVCVCVCVCVWEWRLFRHTFWLFSTATRLLKVGITCVLSTPLLHVLSLLPHFSPPWFLHLTHTHTWLPDSHSGGWEQWVPTTWGSWRSASPLLRQTSDETAANALATVSYHHGTLLVAWGISGSGEIEHFLTKCVCSSPLPFPRVHYVF